MLDVKRADAYVSFFGSSAIPLLVSSCRAVTDVVGAINAAAACTCANILYTRTAWVCALYDIARHGSMQDAAEAMEVKLRRMGQQQVCATCPTQCIGKPAAHAARGGGGHWRLPGQAGFGSRCCIPTGDTRGSPSPLPALVLHTEV